MTNTNSQRSNYYRKLVEINIKKLCFNIKILTYVIYLLGFFLIFLILFFICPVYLPIQYEDKCDSYIEDSHINI